MIVLLVIDEWSFQIVIEFDRLPLRNALALPQSIFVLLLKCLALSKNNLLLLLSLLRLRLTCYHTTTLARGSGIRRRYLIIINVLLLSWYTWRTSIGGCSFVSTGNQMLSLILKIISRWSTTIVAGWCLASWFFWIGFRVQKWGWLTVERICAGVGLLICLVLLEFKLLLHLLIDNLVGTTYVVRTRHNTTCTQLIVAGSDFHLHRPWLLLFMSLLLDLLLIGIGFRFFLVLFGVWIGQVKWWISEVWHCPAFIFFHFL